MHTTYAETLWYRDNQYIILFFPIYKTSYGVIFLDSEENLRAALGKMGVNSRALEDVIDKARNKHYQVRKWLTSFVLETFLFLNLKCYIINYVQLACTLTFEAVHNSSCDAGVNHPNQYFSDSQSILKAKGNPVA